MGADQVAALPDPLTTCVTTASVRRLQPAMPSGVRSNGSGMGPNWVLENPNTMMARDSGRLPRFTLSVVPRMGREPGAAASVGSTRVPAQPAPNEPYAAALVTCTRAFAINCSPPVAQPDPEQDVCGGKNPRSTRWGLPPTATSTFALFHSAIKVAPGWSAVPFGREPTVPPVKPVTFAIRGWPG